MIDCSLKYNKYPNPIFRREKFVILNGDWQFSFEDPNYDKTIVVPFSYETKLSRINDKKQYDVVWYKKEVILSKNKHYILNFLGVDYYCDLIINGHLVGSHKGCFTEFKFDISNYVTEGLNSIVLKVQDSYNKQQLRGKQRTREENYECWYEQTTGIFKTVYLEECGENPIERFHIQGDAEGKVIYELTMNFFEPSTIEIYDDGQIIKSISINSTSELKGELTIENVKLWSPESPNLYDVKVRTKNDEIGSYFGFRSVKTLQNEIIFNGNKIYEKLILNQGYYPESGLTAPSNYELLKDIKTIKDMGFNGFRMHQKIEDPHGYYYADAIGLYVWAEIPSVYEFSEISKQEILTDTVLIQEQLFNHPSIITYVIFNESWGIPCIKGSKEQQEFVKLVFERMKAYDPSKLYIANDGWHNLTFTDILSLHEYQQDASIFAKEYEDFDQVKSEKIINTFGKAFAENQTYSNQPVLISEFGGVSYVKNGWGYGEKATDSNNYKERITKLFNVLHSLPYIRGYCYTQLRDVQQETNGLCDEFGNLRLSLDEIRNIVGGKE